jgi:GNAT superfamily N-acetyltransferase
MSDDVTVRRIGEHADAHTFVQQLAEWHWSAFGNRPMEVRMTELQHHAQQEAPELHTTLVARMGDLVVGSVRVCADDFNGRRPGYTPWLATLYVHPTVRNMGIGALLVRSAVDWAGRFAVDVGVHMIYLYAVNEDAKRLYLRLGWVVIEDTSPPYTPPGSEPASLVSIMGFPSTEEPGP